LLAGFAELPGQNLKFDPPPFSCYEQKQKSGAPLLTRRFANQQRPYDTWMEGRAAPPDAKSPPE